MSVRRAVVVGCQTYGLVGCDADATAMAAVLDRRGFTDVELVVGAAATRDAVLGALDRMVAATDTGDVVVVYYSGHGGRLLRPDAADRRRAGLSPHLSLLVPVDLTDDDVDFRGILTEELSDRQWRLTDTGAAVTTILDCCHSGAMARDTTLVPKAVDRAFPVQAAMARLATLPAARATDGGETNPYAVRLVACQAEQSAYEQPSSRGGRGGVLTDALLGVLDDLDGRRVSWETVGRLVRRRVLDRVPQQRPDVHGAASRYLFDREEERSLGTMPVTRRDGTSVIECARLLGLDVGDEVALSAPGDSAVLATAHVTSLVGGSAVLDAPPDLADPMVATTLRSTAARRVVHVDVPGPSGTELTALVEASARLTTGDGGHPFATVVTRHGLVVLDGAGAPARVHAEPDDAAGRANVVGLLELLAGGARLAELGSGRGGARLTDPVDVELATVVDEARTVRRRSGERLTAGERVSLLLRNLGRRDVFAWVFDVGISGRVSLATNGDPSGIRLEAAGRPEDTRVVWGAAGTPLRWPADVPADAERPETFVVVLADRRQDLRALATSTRGDTPVSELDEVLDEVRDGTRGIGPREGGGLRYRIERVELLCRP